MSLHAITIPLETHLMNLHTVLQKWPNPPTVKATEVFEMKHSRAVRNLSKRIRESQLKLTLWLSESALLHSALHAGLEASLDEHEKVKGIQNGDIAIWESLYEQLQTIPPTLRLSHLVRQLEELVQATSKPQLPQLAGFSEDVKQIKEVVKMVDQRLLVENHFETEIRNEM